eukprot:5581374-Amphidinium_carterae.1
MERRVSEVRNHVQATGITGFTSGFKMSSVKGVPDETCPSFPLPRQRATQPRAQGIEKNKKVAHNVKRAGPKAPSTRLVDAWLCFHLHARAKTSCT